jgi:Protein kinase domain/Leucine Rich repeat
MDTSPQSSEMISDSGSGSGSGCIDIGKLGSPLTPAHVTPVSTLETADQSPSAFQHARSERKLVADSQSLVPNQKPDIASHLRWRNQHHLEVNATKLDDSSTTRDSDGVWDFEFHTPPPVSFPDDLELDLHMDFHNSHATVVDGHGDHHDDEDYNTDKDAERRILEELGLTLDTSSVVEQSIHRAQEAKQRQDSIYPSTATHIRHDRSMHNAELMLASPQSASTPTKTSPVPTAVPHIMLQDGFGANDDNEPEDTVHVVHKVIEHSSSASTPVCPSSASSSPTPLDLPVGYDADSGAAIAAPSNAQVRQMARELGMSLPQDKHLLWIAREALTTTVPKQWRVCQTDGVVYYLNIETGRCQFNDPAPDHFKQLYKTERNAHRAKKLRLSSTSPSHRQHRHRRRHSIDFSRHGLLDDDVSKVLSCLTESTSKLDVSDNYFSDSSIVALCDAMCSSTSRVNVQSFNMSCIPDLSTRAYRAAANLLLKSTSLRALDLSWNHMNDTDIQVLCAGLRHNHVLRCLDVRSNRISVHGMTMLRDAIATSRIEEVQAGGNNLSSAALSQLDFASVLACNANRNHHLGATAHQHSVDVPLQEEEEEEQEQEQETAEPPIIEEKESHSMSWSTALQLASVGHQHMTSIAEGNSDGDEADDDDDSAHTDTDNSSDKPSCETALGELELELDEEQEESIAASVIAQPKPMFARGSAGRMVVADLLNMASSSAVAADGDDADADAVADADDADVDEQAADDLHNDDVSTSHSIRACLAPHMSIDVSDSLLALTPRAHDLVRSETPLIISPTESPRRPSIVQSSLVTASAPVSSMLTVPQSNADKADDSDASCASAASARLLGMALSGNLSSSDSGFNNKSINMVLSLSDGLCAAPSHGTDSSDGGHHHTLVLSLDRPSSHEWSVSQSDSEYEDDMNDESHVFLDDLIVSGGTQAPRTTPSTRMIMSDRYGDDAPVMRENAWDGFELAPSISIDTTADVPMAQRRRASVPCTGTDSTLLETGQADLHARELYAKRQQHNFARWQKVHELHQQRIREKVRRASMTEASFGVTDRVAAAAESMSPSVVASSQPQQEVLVALQHPRHRSTHSVSNAEFDAPPPVQSPSRRRPRFGTFPRSMSHTLMQTDMKREASLSLPSKPDNMGLAAPSSAGVWPAKRSTISGPVEEYLASQRKLNNVDPQFLNNKNSIRPRASLPPTSPGLPTGMSRMSLSSLSSSSSAASRMSLGSDITVMSLGSSSMSEDKPITMGLSSNALSALRKPGADVGMPANATGASSILGGISHVATGRKVGTASTLRRTRSERAVTSSSGHTAGQSDDSKHNVRRGHGRSVSAMVGAAQKQIFWQRGDLLGYGSHGKVFMGMNVRTGQLIAVKQVHLSTDHAERSEQLRVWESEISVMRSLRHDNIVQLLGVERAEDHMYILLEYVPGNSLGTVLQQFGPLDEHVVKSYTRQTLDAIMYCHERGIIHRDIKAKNILVDTQGHVKLADFGSSKVVEDPTKLIAPSMTFNYTPLWTAPEVLSASGSYNSKVDVWSLGCVVLEMLTARAPWAEHNFANPFRALLHISSDGAQPSIPSNLSPAGTKFLHRCFERDVELRPSAAELANDPWLQDAVAAVSPCVPTSSVTHQSQSQPQSQSQSFGGSRPGLPPTRARVPVLNRLRERSIASTVPAQ